MKARKKLSILLSALLTLNLVNGSLLKANAAELTNDITLKSVSISEKLVTPGSEVKVAVEASDSSANLNKDAYAVYVSKGSGSEVEKEVALAMDDTDKKYHASIAIKDPAEAGDWKLSFITIGDEAGNVKIFYNSNVHQELGQDLSGGDFKVIVDKDAPKLGNITLSSNSLVKGSVLKVQINAVDDGIGLADEANLVFVTKADRGDIEKPLTLKLNGGKYEGSLSIDDTFPIGDWKLSFITLEDKIGNIAVLYNSNVHGSEIGTDLSSGNFKVKADTDSPKFLGINVDKKIVKLGDKINVTVTASEETGLAKEANLCYVIKGDKGDLERGVTLNLVDGKYQGTIEVDDTLSSGILSPSFIAFEDTLGNIGITYNSKIHDGLPAEISADMSAGDIRVDMLKPDKPEIVLSTEAPTNKAVEVTISTKEVNGKVEYKLDGQSGWTAYNDKLNVNDNTTVYARVSDEAGNLSDEVEKKITNIDKVAPVITITGVENGQVYNKTIKPVISIDDTSAATAITLNGNVYDGKEISQGGVYNLKVVATDKAGNVSEKVVNFTIDATAPTITIKGVEDGKAYNTDVKPEVTVDGKECTVKVSLNDNTFNSGDVITTEGSYKLVVNIVDGFNRSYEVVKNFTIDKTKPVITISGVNDKAFYKDKVNIGVSVNEAGTTILAKLNGEDLVSNEVAGEGAYTLVVTAIDKAGNISVVAYNFTIDKTAPVINVLGVENGGVYKGNIWPVVKVDDINSNTTVITLNSKLYDGKPITAEGSYEFKVVATDKARNTSELVYKFSIDKTAPVITVDGVDNGGLYKTDITPVIKVDDVNIATKVITLNSQPYDGRTITADGSYELKVAATDKAENATEVVYKFVIDKTAPIIAIEGVKDGEFYKTDITPVIKVDDADATKVITLNSKKYDGKPISEEGNYELKVVATDKAGNPSELVYKFVIDKTAPVNIIKGVKDGEVYNRDVHPDVSEIEFNLKTTEVTLNSKPYQGETVTEEGNYEFKVISTDRAGNSSTTFCKFSIDKTLPVITIDGVNDGGVYNDKVTPVVKVNDINATTTDITLNSKPYDVKPITAEGNYELIVVATDKAGNSSTSIYKFSIDKTAPVITVEGIEDGKTYLGTSVQPTVKVNESAKITATLDEKPYNLGAPIETLGEHKLTVTAVDNAGNTSKKDIKFNLQVAIPKDADKAANTIKDLAKDAKQDRVVLSGNENPVLDAKVFEALKGIEKPVSVTVESQGMTLTWTFNGKDVTDTTKSVDLTLNAVAPNKDLITKVDSNAEIISFKNHGTLPAPMTVTIPVDTKKFDVTKPINFYYYNETTKKAELIAENLKAYQKGYAYFVDVTITHCSDYFLSASDSKTVLPKVEKLVQTGSPLDMNVLVGLGILLIGTGFVVVLARRKRS